MDRIYEILNGISEATIKQSKAEDVSIQPRFNEEQVTLISEDDSENETPEMEMEEYKQEFFEMSAGSIKSIAHHAQEIVNGINDGSIKECLTESWLQGKIAIIENDLLTVYNYVMFGDEEDDTEDMAEAKKNLPGLWENIRKKKEREGKKYRPAKPGDKDRPDPEQWKKLTK